MPRLVGMLQIATLHARKAFWSLWSDTMPSIWHEPLIEMSPASAVADGRAADRIPVALPGEISVNLNPGGQNLLLKKMIEEFCTLFAPDGEVLYAGDADTGAVFQQQGFAALGVAIDQHDKMPDLVVYMRERNWLVLLEAASSHGPVDVKRHRELQTLFGAATAVLVLVSCFPDRREMRKHLSDIAWETAVWCADEPTHLIHFNGSRLLGPHDSRKQLST